MNRKTFNFYLRLLLVTLIVLSSLGAVPFLPFSQPLMVKASSLQQTGGWIEGAIQYSEVINCLSIANGNPYVEYGIGVYTGYYTAPNDNYPSPNDVYYLTIVMAGVGNPCNGSYIYVEIVLPPSTSLAIDPTNPLHCYYKDRNGTVHDYTNDVSCPQSLPASTINNGAFAILSNDQQHARMWALAQSTWLEFQIPVVSTTPLMSQPFRANLTVADGYSTPPWLNPQVGVTVFNASNPIPTDTPTNTPTPTTSAPTDTPTPTNTPTPTTSGPTSTPTNTNTPTPTTTGPTSTPTNTNTPTPTTSGPTSTPTNTNTPTPTTTGPTSTPTPTNTPTPPTGGSTTGGSGAPGQHVVRAGETLFCIGRGYGVLPWAIASANRLQSPYRIFPGQTLIIPNVPWTNIPAGPVCMRQFDGTPPMTTPPPTTPPPDTGCRAIYTVMRGDTLYRISRIYGVSIPSLASANRISNVNLIYVGQRLCIP